MLKKFLKIVLIIIWTFAWLVIGTTIGMKDTGKCYMGQENYCPAQYCTLGK